MLKNVFFSLKIVKIAKRWGSASDPLAFGGWEFRPQTLSVILLYKFFSLHLPTRPDSWNRPKSYVLEIIAGVRQAFGVENIMLHFLC